MEARSQLRHRPTRGYFERNFSYNNTGLCASYFNSAII